MKIVLFEVREDELNIIDALKEQYQLDMEIHREPLSLQRVEVLKGAAGISILAGTRLDADALDRIKAGGIRYISLRCIGMDHVDAAYAESIGLKLRAAAYPPNAVADFTVMLMLIALRKYKPALWRQNVNDYSLAGLQGKNMANMTVGILGTGKIGKQVIKNLSGFGCRLLAYNLVKEKDVEEYAEYVELDQLFKNSDILSIHIPLTTETEHIIDAKALNKMKDGVILVNTSRGELMNIQDMIEAVENQKIGALAMDVFENDLTIYHKNHSLDIIKNREMAYLRQFPNVILTQHMAFYTEESVESMVISGIESLFEMEREDNK